MDVNCWRLRPQLAAEGLKRQQLGREEFEHRVWQWKEEYGGRITDDFDALLMRTFAAKYFHQVGAQWPCACLLLPPK